MLSEAAFSDRRYLYCEEMSKLGIKNGFTFRLGGVSRGKVEGFNFGFRVGDERKNVLENYRLLAQDLQLEFRSITVPKQMHTANIKTVTSKDRGRGVTVDNDIYNTDGLITCEKDLPLMVFSADCYPVLLADKEKRAVAAVHSGWRGTLSEISKKAVLIMEKEFGIKPQDIIAAVGPGIGSCCFETESDVASKFELCFVKEKGRGKYLIDLPSVIKKSLLDAGLNEQDIFLSGRCTMCESDKFYSYRVHKDKTGRMGAVISL